MQKLIESQTQVYTNGQVDPQYRNNNLHMLTSQFFSSGKSDAQVLAILCGMGVPQPWALQAIEEYNLSKGGGCCGCEGQNEQKNDIKMQFTLTELYEKVTKTLEKLQEMKEADAGRVSYTANNAMTVLENTLKQFPVALKNADLQMCEEVEKSANPALKFSIAKSLYNQSTLYSWLNPMTEMIGYLDNFYDNAKLAFKVNEAYEAAKKRGGSLYEKLGTDLYNVLSESAENMKNKFLAISTKHPWSPECKSILEDIAKEQQIVHEQRGGKIVKLFSPILTEGNTHTFHLAGRDYTFDGKKVKEAHINNVQYFNVLEGLKLCSYKNGMFTISSQNENDLTINIDEGTINIGDIDLTNASVIEIHEALLGTNFFGYRDAYKIDIVCKLIESFDMVTEMDQFLSINSLIHPSLFLTMISVEEGVYVHRLNGGMQLNEMKYYSSASEACQIVKEFINYDVSSYLVEQLEKEGNTLIRQQENRKKIQEMVEFLEGKKKEITASITKVGETPELKEALELIDAEITLKEKELQETFITEKKSKGQYLNDGYVEAQLKKSVAGLKKGTEIMVNAEEYASLGDDELVDIINPKTGKSHYIKKSEVNVEF